MRGANCDSDHFLIRTIIRHKISHTYQKKQEYKLRWDIYKFENKDKKNEYQEYITEKLKETERKQDVNEEWINKFYKEVKEMSRVSTTEYSIQRRKRKNINREERYTSKMATVFLALVRT